MNKFKAGDIVMHKISKIKMAVVHANGFFVVCHWFEGDELKQKMFLSIMLTL